MNGCFRAALVGFETNYPPNSISFHLVQTNFDRMDDSLEMVPLWSSGMVHQPLMQVHNYHRFGRRFSVNDPDAHSSVLDYMHCHLIDDYVVCDVSHLILI